MRLTAALVLLLIAAACSPTGAAPAGLPAATTAPPGPEDVPPGPSGQDPGQPAPAAPPQPGRGTPKPAAGRAGASTAPTPVAREYTIQSFSYRQLLGRDAIRPIYAPEYISADQAGYQPNELVLGVCVQGDCRAYPIGVLNWREMVNDELGGIPILATW